MWRVIVQAIIFTIIAASNVQSADKIKVDCVVQDDHKTLCDVRSLDINNMDIRSVTARIAERDKSVGELKLVAPDAVNASDEIAIAFLVDGSLSMPAKAPEIISDQLSQWIEQSKDVFVFGIAKIGKRLEWLADVGADKLELSRAVEKIDRKSNETALLDGILKAAEVLKSRNARRSFIVVMSDGLAEDNVRKVDDVVNAANAAGVKIFTVGYPANKGTNVTEHQALEVLSEKTGGIFIETDPDSQIPEQSSTRMLRLFDNGGQVLVDTSDETKEATLTLTVAFADGSLATADRLLGFTAQPTIWQQMTNLWTSGPSGKVTIAGGGLAILALLLMLTMLAARAARTEPEPAVVTAAETEIEALTTAAEGTGLTYGFLDLQDGDGPPRREPITSTSFRIGRSDTNDLVLENSTVSNDHAVVTVDQNNAFEIRDIHSANGTHVNGHRTGRAFLNDGDIIEIGRVRMKFVMRA